MIRSKNLTNVSAIAVGLCAAAALLLCLLPGTAGAVDDSDALVVAPADALVEEPTDTVPVGSAPRYLADGTYVFDVDKNRALVVDVAKSSKTAVGAKVVMATDAASKSQRWAISWDDQRGAYRMKNANSGLYLTTKAAKAGKELVSQKKYSANDKKQLWTLEKDGTGFRILSLAEKSVGLGTADAKARAGSYITTQSSKAKKFKFYILPVDERLMKPTAAAPKNLNGKFVSVSLSSGSDLVIGIKNDDASDNATATLVKKSGSQSRKWYLKAVDAGAGVYSVVNFGSGKALKVAGKGRHIGTDVVQGTVKASDKTQQWWVRSTGKGYTFTSRYNGLTLRSTGAKSGANVNLALGTASNRQFQLKSVAPLGKGCYRMLVRKKPALSWGIAKESTKQNVQLTVGERKSTLLWQKFMLERASDGAYTIRSVASNRFVGEAGGKVVQGTRSSNSAQRWKVVFASGGFALKNASSGRFLSVSGSVKSGAKLVASAKCKASASQFAFSKCRLVENGIYYLNRNGNASKVMGFSQADAKNANAKIGIFKKANVQSYKFRFGYAGNDPAGNETYRIQNLYSGKYLTASGNGIVQKEKSNSKAQRWAALVMPGGMLAFKNVATGKAISSGSKNLKTASYDSKSSYFRWGLETTTSLTQEQVRAYDMINATFSNTNYSITADLSNHRVRVWERAKAGSPWTLKYDWICSNGKWSTPTPAVNLLTRGSKRFKNRLTRPDGTLYSSSFYYMTYIDKGKYFHTPLYKKGSMTKYSDARMGRFISNGCIRVQTPNAIWIYKHIKKGTRVITYY